MHPLNNHGMKLIHMKKLVKLCLVVVVTSALAFTSLWAISMSLTPDPYPTSGNSEGAIVRVYGANVWGVRGYFAMHTWIATKARDEKQFNIHEVIGWKLRRNNTALSKWQGNPNRSWFGSKPVLLYELTGDEASRLIPDVLKAVINYPYQAQYTMWPGPNSNSFTEWVALEVPELALQLPIKAIGKDWMKDNYPE